VLRDGALVGRKVKHVPGEGGVYAHFPLSNGTRGQAARQPTARRLGLRGRSRPVRIGRFSRVYHRDTPVDSILRPRFVVKVSLGCEVVELSQAQ
jgi:hypothetical protein